MITAILWVIAVVAIGFVVTFGTWAIGLAIFTAAMSGGKHETGKG